jgi:uncharacterized repeat protein (TIGR02543 family)
MKKETIFKSKKVLNAAIAVVLLLVMFALPQIASAATTGVYGRYLPTYRTGDSSDWVEIAKCDGHSLIVRKACLTNLGQVVFSNSNIDHYSISLVRDLVNNWFKNTLGSQARLRNFTVKSNALQDLGAFGNISYGISKPTTTAARTGDDVAFLLSFAEAAQYCSLQYAINTTNVAGSSAIAKNNFNMLTRPGSGVMKDFWWLRTAGHSATSVKNASSVGTHGGMLSDGTVYASSSQAAYPYVRPALWVGSGIFDDDKLTVTYQPNGGTGSSIVDEVTPNTNYTIRQNPGYTRTNYTFVGWNTNADGTGTNYSPGQVVYLTTSMTLYAKWTLTVVPISITYYPNGGTGSNVVDNVSANTYYTIRQNQFTRPGFDFDGWNTNANGAGTNYSAGQLVYITSTLNLYAKWKLSATTVTYNPNGGTGSEIIDNIVANNYYTIRQNTFTRTGYIFDGWNTYANGAGTNYSAGQLVYLTSSLYLYAKWKPDPALKVTYYPNNGIGNIIADPVNFGASYTIRQNPNYTRQGYFFDGWNTEANGSGVNYAPGQVITITGSLNLYAKWGQDLPQGTIVAYIPNGSTDNPSIYFVSLYTFYTIQDQGYTRPGYTQNGWNTAPDGTGTQYQNGQVIYITDMTILYAQWRPDLTNQYTVTYYPNGGVGQINEVKVNPNASYIIADQGYTRYDHFLLGWNTKADGTGTYYATGQVITVTGDLPLYALWFPRF